MRRHAVVLVLVVLAVTAPAVVAASSHTALVVGSAHTSDSDFQSAADLTNITVSGSGSDASAQLTIDQYNVIDDSGDGSADGDTRFVGDNPDGTAYSTEWKTVPNAGGSVDSLIIDGRADNADYGFVVDIYAVNEDPDGDYGEGQLVKSGWDPDFVDGTQTISLDSNLDVSAGETWTFEFITQSTDGDGIADQVDLRFDQDSTFTGWRSFTTGGSSPSIEDGGGNITLVGAEKARTSGSYISDTHTVERAEQAFINLTLQDAHADYRIEYGGGPWQTAAQGTLPSTGNHTIDISGHESETEWRTNVSLDNETAAPTTAEIHDEGIQFNARSPEVDNATASPTGGLSSSDPTLSIDISDADFPLAQGDDLTATWYVNGSQVGTSTGITSNGTISQSVSGLSGGSHTWHVELEGEYGLEATSDTFSISTPDEITVRKEFAPDQLVSENIDLTFYFQESGTTVERDITDGSGTADLSGLPTGEPMIVVADAPSYHSRRIFLEDLYQSEDIFLLATANTTDTTTFTHRDYSGEFPKEETVLQVQRVLNVSNTADWRTVEGDYFGATGEFQAELRHNVRHRLVLRNVETGQVREDFGSFTPVGEGTHLVQINADAEVALHRFGPLATFDPSIPQLPANGNANVTVTVDNQSTALQDWSYTMTYREGGTSQVLASDTLQGPAGDTVMEDLNLSGMAAGNLTVDVTITTQDGTQFDETQVYAISDVFQNDHSLLTIVGDIGTRVPGDAGAFQSFMAVVVTILGAVGVAYALPVSTETIGFVAVLLLSGFVAVGWFPLSYLFIAGAAVVTFAGLRRGV